jgi:D-arabinose 1-dehydrogenase-like Zn-dependent alcohol dehydrogenase
VVELSPVTDEPITNYVWPFFGKVQEGLGLHGKAVAEPLRPAAPHEVIARVDAVCVCSSDVKLMRMGSAHPLFKGRDLAQSPIVLGHEVALTVCDVGANWQESYKPGQRLGLQPAIIRDGQRTTIGIDLAGGFGQYIILDDHVLGGPDPYVFPVPEEMSSAAVAMLEPYACVEAAYRPNCRTSLHPGGRLLVVGQTGGETMTLDADLAVAEAVLIAAPPAVEEWAQRHAARVSRAADLAALGDARFDDILLCGAFDPARTEAAFARLADGGLLALIGAGDDDATGRIDPALIHYRALSIVGAPGPSIDAAFGLPRNRFDLAPGGATLILGAGGAMGRIHLHRALELAEGPALVIAVSRQKARLDALRADFAPLAARRGRRLEVLADEDLEEALLWLVPQGCDDVVVAAPDLGAIERGASVLRPGGMLVIFAGTPFGAGCPLPLGQISRHGTRLTGSTGCTVADQKEVLARVLSGDLDLAGNLEAVCGFAALPDAVRSVAAGEVCGKIAIFPSLPDLELTAIKTIARPGDTGTGRWTRADEQRLGAA